MLAGLLLPPMMQAAAAAFVARSGDATVTVDTATFGYSIALRGAEILTDGSVAMQCNGARFDAADGSLVGGPVTLATGTDAALGAFRCVTRTWTFRGGRSQGNFMELITEVREYSRADGA